MTLNFGSFFQYRRFWYRKTFEIGIDWQIGVTNVLHTNFKLDLGPFTKKDEFIPIPIHWEK